MYVRVSDSIAIDIINKQSTFYESSRARFIFTISPYHSVNHRDSMHKLNKHAWLQAMNGPLSRRLSRMVAFIFLHINHFLHQQCLILTNQIE